MSYCGHIYGRSAQGPPGCSNFLDTDLPQRAFQTLVYDPEVIGNRTY